MSAETNLLKGLRETYTAINRLFTEACKLRNETEAVMASLSVALKEYHEAHPKAADHSWRGLDGDDDDEDGLF